MPYPSIHTQSQAYQAEQPSYNYAQVNGAASTSGSDSTTTRSSGSSSTAAPPLAGQSTQSTLSQYYRTEQQKQPSNSSKQSISFTPHEQATGTRVTPVTRQQAASQGQGMQLRYGPLFFIDRPPKDHMRQQSQHQRAPSEALPAISAQSGSVTAQQRTTGPSSAGPTTHVSAASEAQAEHVKKTAVEEAIKRMALARKEVKDILKTVEYNSTRIIFRIVVNKLKDKMSRGPSGGPVQIPSIEGLEAILTQEQRQLADAVVGKVQVSDSRFRGQI